MIDVIYIAFGIMIAVGVLEKIKEDVFEILDDPLREQISELENENRKLQRQITILRLENIKLKEK